MSYDRLGRRAPTPSEAEGEADAAASATPNAARLARGRAAAAAMRSAQASNAEALGKTVAAKPAKAKRRPAALRILPVTAFVAALVLSFRVADLWEQRETLVESVTVGTVAVASSTASGASAAGGTAPSDQGSTLAGAAGQPAPVQGQATGTDSPFVRLAQSGSASGDDRVDPFNLGKSQIELLQSLAERRRELEERERTLVQREGLLAAAEHRIEQKIEELNGIKGEIEELIRKYDDQEEDQLKGLVKIYETMKPKDAARIFNGLDMDILLQVIERMKASRTAAVLAEMAPERAKEVTLRIAERRSMPDIN